jgi:hypothetical protein
MEVPKLKSITPMEFFGKLFQIRTQIHIKHLRISGTGSYAGHIALHDFYDAILGLTDSLIESYQGKYGIVDLKVKECCDDDAVKLLEDLAKLTDGGQVYSMFKETWIQNQIDEISTLTYQTLYKLKNLK